MTIVFIVGDAVALLIGRRICDLHVAGSVRVLVGHHCVLALGKLLITCVPLSPSSIFW